MTAINLALRNLYGHVIWGNSLANERRLIYRTGLIPPGVVREIPIEECPAAVQQTANESIAERVSSGEIVPANETPLVPGSQQRADADLRQATKQLKLF